MRQMPAWTPPKQLPELRVGRLRPTVWIYGKAAPRDYIEEWSPARWVRNRQACSWCWGPIGRSEPGSTTGSRGTKAFICVPVGLWRHVECHHEAQLQEMDHRDALVAQATEEREVRNSEAITGPSTASGHG